MKDFTCATSAAHGCHYPAPASYCKVDEKPSRERSAFEWSAGIAASIAAGTGSRRVGG